LLFEAGSAHGQAGLVAVPSKESRDCFSVGRKMLLGAFHRRDDLAELFEILVVRHTFLRVAPQLFDWVLVRRVARQLINRQPLLMLRKELLRGLAGMIFGPILDEKQVLRRLGQHAQEKGLVTWRVKLAMNSHADRITRYSLPRIGPRCNTISRGLGKPCAIHQA
jgi:hypothetical protein